MKNTNRHESNITINGSIAFVGEKPWILSRTLEDNILFSRSKDKKRYEDSIKFSSLIEDLQVLTKGD